MPPGHSESEAFFVNEIFTTNCRQVLTFVASYDIIIVGTYDYGRTQ